MAPQPKPHRERHVPEISPPGETAKPAPAAALPLAIAPGTAPPPPVPPLPNHRGVSIAKLRAEWRDLYERHQANAKTIGDLQAENASIRKRHTAIEAQIKHEAWDGEPPVALYQ